MLLMFWHLFWSRKWERRRQRLESEIITARVLRDLHLDDYRKARSVIEAQKEKEK
jgi:hypothetical protein